MPTDRAPDTSEPTIGEWLEHAKHGVQSLSDLYHDGGKDGNGITVKEFRDGCDFIWQQINGAFAALNAAGYDVARIEPPPEWRHTKNPWAEFCLGCSEPWPCSSQRVLDRAAGYDVARIEEGERPDGLPSAVPAAWLWAYAEAVATLLIHEELDGYEHTGSLAIDDVEQLEAVHRRVLDEFDPLPFDLDAWLRAALAASDEAARP